MAFPFLRFGYYDDVIERSLYFIFTPIISGMLTLAQCTI